MTRWDAFWLIVGGLFGWLVVWMFVLGFESVWEVW
jgi:hypothetical protein